MKAHGHPRLRFSKADPAGSKGLTWLPKMETVRYLVGDQDEQVLLTLPAGTLVTSLVAIVTEAAEVDITADLTLGGNEVFADMDLDDQGDYYEITSQIYLEAEGDLEITTSAGGTLTGIVDILLSYIVVSEMMEEADASVAAVRTESPRLTASEDALDFGEVEVDDTDELALTLENTGTALLTIDSIVLTDVDEVFAILELGDLDFPYELDPAEELELTVAFTPDAEDTFAGAITITADDPTLVGGELEVGLAGEGVITPVLVPGLDVAPALDFGEIYVGETSQPSALIITSVGTGDLTIDLIEITGDDSDAFDAGLEALEFPLVLAPLAELELAVTFQPAGVGEHSALLSIVSDDADSPHTVALTGAGLSVPIGSLETDPVGALAFGNVIEGQTKDMDLELINTGNEVLEITAMTFGGAGAARFSRQLPAQLPLVVQPGAQASFMASIRFSPIAPGAVSATLDIVHDGDNSPVVIDLSGTGEAAEAILSTTPATEIDWGQRLVGGFYNENLALQNDGNVTLTITEMNFAGAQAGDFSRIEPAELPLNILPSAFYNATIRFTPGAAGARTGTLSIVSNDDASPKVINLLGEGTE